jgi:hypothetical protein
MKDHGESISLCEISTPIKRALCEMLFAGNLIRHRRPRCWVSIGGKRFYDRTIEAMAVRYLVVMAAESGQRGKLICSLTQIGRYVAQALASETMTAANVVPAPRTDFHKLSMRERSGVVLEDAFK